MPIRNRRREISWNVEEKIAEFLADHPEYGGAKIRQLLLDDPKLERQQIPQLRTIQRMVKEIRGNLGPLDRPFQWHRMGEWGLPWEASEFILGMWAYAKELSADLEWSLQYSVPLPPPSVRLVHWWWRVHQAAPDETRFFVWMWGRELWRCDLYKDILGKPADPSGIEAYLAYKPWQNPKQQDIYDRAIKRGTISPLPPALVGAMHTEELRGNSELLEHFPQPGPATYLEAHETDSLMALPLEGDEENER